jgi:SNF2 family DNA or RNA helicase
MLFYNQIKREFTQASWKRGQAYFREERVSNVRLDGNLVVAQVQGTDEAPYEAAIVMQRGSIFNSDCSCPAHRLYETHCKHVAALCIWVVERGSLLRAGIGGSEDGVAEAEDDGGDHYLVLSDVEKAKADIRIRKLLTTQRVLTTHRFKVRRDQAAGLVFGHDAQQRSFSIPITLPEAVALQEHSIREELARARMQTQNAEPVAFVRGVFANKVLSAISIEAALRYTDPATKAVQVETISHLIRGKEAGTFRTSEGLYLKLLHEFVPVLISIDAAKIVYQGQSALDHLAKLLTHEHRSNIVFHQAVNIEYDNRPLKLTTMNIGKKTDKSRLLTYEFANNHIRFASDELAALAEQGRLSSQYVWKENKLYRFEISLTSLARYANRSGVASNETPTRANFVSDGFSQLEDDSQHPLHPIAAYRLSLELGVENFNVDDDWKEFHEWRKQFEKTRTPPLPKVEYGFELRDYQVNGLSWMWSLYHRGLGALLADDMGLGKTHQVLAFLSSLYRARSKPKLPSLVIAPTSVVAAWEQKLQKYPTGLKYSIFHGKGRVLPESDVSLVLTTYGILQKEAALRNREWHVVVLDEAQAIKNATTISARASRSLKAAYRVAMTGTPIENQSTDLWSIMEFLLPGYLGSLPRFKRLYGSGRETPSEAQAQALKRLVSPFLLRRTKVQVLKELPEKTEEVISCEMTANQKKAYRAFLNSAEATKVRENLTSSGAKIDYASILALLTRLKQVCDHPRLPDLSTGKVKKVKSLDPLDSGKWEAFDELVTEALGSNLKVVVFTQYLGVIDLMSEFLTSKGIGHTELRGDTSDRAVRLKKFAEDPECKVFLCSLLAGGLGIDLTSASVCIHYDRWWNPAKENQATDRLHRIGQTRGVQVFKLQIPGTIEDRIAQIIESKTSLSGTLIEESPLGLKAFSRKELLALLTDPGNGSDEEEHEMPEYQLHATPENRDI